MKIKVLGQAMRVRVEQMIESAERAHERTKKIYAPDELAGRRVGVRTTQPHAQVLGCDPIGYTPEQREGAIDYSADRIDALRFLRSQIDPNEIYELDLADLSAFGVIDTYVGIGRTGMGIA